jgi:hypothetical protein
VTADVQVLARIRAQDFHCRPQAYRDEVLAWLDANGVNPADIPANWGSRDVEIVLLDAPAIARDEVVRDSDGRVFFDEDPTTGGRTIRRRRVHSLLRVPLPEHLADPT